MTELDAAYQPFIILDTVSISTDDNGLSYLDISNNSADARISIYGAQILSYTPDQAHDVLWMSAHSTFEIGKAIRGGIPICWPHFGASEILPNHGFARTSVWELHSTQAINDQETEIILRLHDNEETRAAWPHAFELEYRIVIGQQLSCQLCTRNIGNEAMHVTAALHSYFSTDLKNTHIRGLEGAEYTIDGKREHRLSEDTPIHSQGVVIDRVYDDTDATCYCDDRSRNRCIVIKKSGSNSTVVWNPHSPWSISTQDFGDEEYRDMFCIETSNAGRDSIDIAPGEEHTLQAIIYTEEIDSTIL